MTNEEAREILEKLIPQPQRGDGKSITHLMITEALTMAIEVLEQQPCEDCISREAVKEMLTEEWTKYMPMELDINLSFVLEKISEMPSVTPKYTDEEIDKAQAVEQAYIDKMVELAVKETERPKGRWNHWTDDYKDYVTCSECEYGAEGEVFLSDKTPFCPICGADMRESDKE